MGGWSGLADSIHQASLVNHFVVRMAAGVQGNSVIFENREYAVLCGTSPLDSDHGGGSNYGAQCQFLPLPDDWEFAPTGLGPPHLPKA